jgi:GT2 family glycosyltransferase
VPKISWVILTYNRGDTVQRSIRHNLNNCGHGIDEIIWVDNGSESEEFNKIVPAFPVPPDVVVQNRENLGVAKGYNRGIILATGDLIVITGCDRLMPDRWLAKMVEHFEKIPETGIISVYSQPPEVVPERFKNDVAITEERNGLDIIPAMPMGAKMFRRSLLKFAGHLREDFGLYGWEDVEWGFRLRRVLEEQKQISYILPNFLAEHLGSEGIKEFNGKDGEDYHAFKQREAHDPRKSELLAWCKDNEYPYYTPYV